MKKKNELYDDVLKDEPPHDADKKTEKEWTKRLHCSVGWCFPLVIAKVETFYDRKKGKSFYCQDAEDIPQENIDIHYDVVIENEGMFTCKKQINAELLSRIVQINERLKRVEKKMDAVINDKMNKEMRKATKHVSDLREKVRVIKNADFEKLLTQKQMINLAGNNKWEDWLDLAQSDELINILEKKGFADYMKKYKQKLASKGFYKELFD